MLSAKSDATGYLLGSRRRLDKLVESLGITSLSKSQASRMAADLDGWADAFRTRPLGDAGGRSRSWPQTRSR